MFMKTMAVGPLEDVASCMTGGMTVAIDLLDRTFCCMGVRREHVAVVLEMAEGEVYLDSGDSAAFVVMASGLKYSVKVQSFANISAVGHLKSLLSGLLVSSMIL